MTAIARLLDVSSSALSNEVPTLNDLTVAEGIDRRMLSQLLEMLRQKNGFVAFENSLQVFPTANGYGVPTIASWNTFAGWRQAYAHIGANVLFFAHDVFGGQFGLTSNCIIRLNPETGETESHSDTLEGWATRVLADYDFEVGWSAAKAWQQQHGALPLSCRLLPKVPFVLGGDYVIENLVSVESRKALQLLANLSSQVRNVPDGEPLTVHGWLVGTK